MFPCRESLIYLSFCFVPSTPAPLLSSSILLLNCSQINIALMLIYSEAYLSPLRLSFKWTVEGYISVLLNQQKLVLRLEWVNLT